MICRIMNVIWISCKYMKVSMSFMKNTSILHKHGKCAHDMHVQVCVGMCMCACLVAYMHAYVYVRTSWKTPSNDNATGSPNNKLYPQYGWHCDYAHITSSFHLCIWASFSCSSGAGVIQDEIRSVCIRDYDMTCTAGGEEGRGSRRRQSWWNMPECILTTKWHDSTRQKEKASQLSLKCLDDVLTVKYENARNSL